MPNLSEIEVFAAVVKAGSFTKASRILKMPKSSVSRKVGLLEERLGVALIQRTTRQLHLTEIGTDYFRTCTRLLAELSEAEANVKNTQNSPKGLLRVTAPVELGISFLEDVILRLLKNFPDVRVDLILTDRIVDLLEEGVDVALRTGELPDSGLIAKKIGMNEFHLFASPNYLKSAGTPTHPRDLQPHICLNFTGHGEGESWNLHHGKTQFELKKLSRVNSSSLGLLYSLTLKGEGVGLLPSFMAREAVKLGKLVRILPDWTSGSEPLSVVYPAQKFVSPKLKAFLECLNQSILRNS